MFVYPDCPEPEGEPPTAAVGEGGSKANGFDARKPCNAHSLAQACRVPVIDRTARIDIIASIAELTW